ncbi:Ectonucleoside triphosphate diphosphohydrolase 5 [Hypsibius exemplaris]|uniref:Ectonucleoside triphosphate diphosphohydrolase 5 n=1 Tax=Hypsibius exemplaris TaxID=2072580 RepID=A0A9X6NH03_HYPEX|nr:Ectonucleoside triphosphate diphosphohydrolase 5 [Hypsibius exemplaris]
MALPRRIFLMILLFILSTSQFFLVISGLSTLPFWSQDVHSTFPFSIYSFPHGSPPGQHQHHHHLHHHPSNSHYTAESAFKAGYSVEETVSPELVKYDNYTGDIYGIMVDAGSTGTRLSAFHFVKSLRPPYMRLMAECGKHLKPGLSYYAAQPDLVYENIVPLMSRAMECIPKYLWATTPMELKATAGLRLLPPFIQDRILDNVKDYLKSHSPFVLSHDESISIMEGIDEGLYSWITVNYLLDTLHHKYEGEEVPEKEHSIKRLFQKEKLKQQTVGTLDLGGGSMQITFIPLYDWTIAKAPPEFIHRVRIFGEKLKLYSWSYLGFGLMSARMQMFGLPQENSDEAWQSTSNRLQSACVHPDITVQWQHASTDYVVSGLPHHSSSHNTSVPSSSSRFLECYHTASDLVSASIHHESEISKEVFYAFSYFYDVAVEAEIIGHVAGGEIAVGVFRLRAQEVCDEEKRPERPFLCMDLSYISALLMDGFGFREDQRMVLRKKINGVETSWALGAMFHLLNTFHNTSQLELPRN